VYGYVMKPAGFTGGKAPVAFLIHGGPQGSFGDHFHYRWNPQVYAGRGYGVVFIDFHGSTGYGQAFTDSEHTSSEFSLRPTNSTARSGAAVWASSTKPRIAG
jgi:dipeptidyl aminopeptidase/acylaminoacyl peptidase